MSVPRRLSIVAISAPSKAGILFFLPPTPQTMLSSRIIKQGTRSLLSRGGACATRVPLVVAIPVATRGTGASRLTTAGRTAPKRIPASTGARGEGGGGHAADPNIDPTRRSMKLAATSIALTGAGYGAYALHRKKDMKITEDSDIEEDIENLEPSLWTLLLWTGFKRR